MTGTMNPQGKANFGFHASALPGTYATATTSSGSSGVAPFVQNLLLTSPGGTPPVYNVAGTQNPGNQTVTGTYTLSNAGTGTITLIPPPPASIQNYVIYALGTLGCAATPTNPNPACEVESFLMMDEGTQASPNPNAAIIFAQQ
jgi:hypothetical protein